MKYKDLKRVLNTHIRESNSSYADPDAGASLTSGSIASFKIEDKETLDQINAFLRIFCIERHQDPKYALVLLRTKLNTLGLDFSYDGRRPLSPKETFHLTQFGGRTGIDDQGKQLNDDGISHRNDGKGMELYVEINSLSDDKDCGSYYIHAKIQTSGNAQPDPDYPISKGEAAASLEK